MEVCHWLTGEACIHFVYVFLYFLHIHMLAKSLDQRISVTKKVELSSSHVSRKPVPEKVWPVARDKKRSLSSNMTYYHQHLEIFYDDILSQFLPRAFIF
jgi:hypothetical protein